MIGRVIDVFLAFPLLRRRDPGRAASSAAGSSAVVVALVALGWMTTARLARGQVLALREAEYVEAARSIGAGNGRIVVRHILPNAIAPVLVYAFTNIGVVVVAMASLSYLGVGVPPDVPEWGRLINQATPFLRVPGKDAPVAGAVAGDRAHHAGVRVRRRRAARRARPAAAGRLMQCHYTDEPRLAASAHRTRTGWRCATCACTSTARPAWSRPSTG